MQKTKDKKKFKSYVLENKDGNISITKNYGEELLIAHQQNCIDIVQYLIFEKNFPRTELIRERNITILNSFFDARENNKKLEKELNSQQENKSVKKVKI